MNQNDGCQKIIIADDHPLYRAGLKQALIQMMPDVEFIEADTLRAVREAVKQHSDVDLVLLDLHMPGANGFSGLAWLRCQNPGMPVVVVSGSEEPSVMSRSIIYGASGFIPKSSCLNRITEGIKAVLEGEVWLPEEAAEEEVDENEANFAANLKRLTNKQFEILMYLNEGLLNKQIAYDLSIKETTVKTHVSAILRKLEVYSRTQVVIEIRRLHLAETPVIWD
ncbi:MAG: response regulator transcription factor [Motiliproteus sp.]